MTYFTKIPPPRKIPVACITLLANGTKERIDEFSKKSTGGKSSSQTLISHPVVTTYQVYPKTVAGLTQAFLSISIINPCMKSNASDL